MAPTEQHYLNRSVLHEVSHIDEVVHSDELGVHTIYLFLSLEGQRDALQWLVVCDIVTQRMRLLGNQRGHCRFNWRKQSPLRYKNHNKWWDCTQDFAIWNMTWVDNPTATWNLWWKEAPFPLCKADFDPAFKLGKIVPLEGGEVTPPFEH